ncbi:hypothetical protein CPLU01_04177 [Colletotrichum plurivorum]|uniref:HNH nuclease domain-containing protein n=1 Tax=Colletotrichum plurivorum TaxID=2175906 RepID=A0A8H6KQA5_9PEZI|nr:hypothetical protein CPLU01_04177 [Colletotrichum plurivorum]
METGGYLGDVARKMALIEKIGQHTQPLIGKWPEYEKASFWSMLLSLDVSDLRRILGDLEKPEKNREALKKLRSSAGVLPSLLKLYIGRYLGAMSGYFDEADGLRLEDLLVPSNHKIDHISNMICLSPQLHTWWGQGQFLLAPMGQPFQEEVPVSTATESPNKPATRGAAKKTRKVWTQEVRFYWTQFTDARGMEVDMPLHTDPRTLFRTPSGGREACNINTWRPLDDGQVAKFHAELKGNLPAYELLDLQAKLIRAWALTAAADPQEYKRFDDKDDEDLDAKYEDLRRSIVTQYFLPLDD